MWLAAALTSGLPSISAPKRPAAAPPSFPCRDKVYGNHTGCASARSAVARAMTCGFLGLRHGQTRGLRVSVRRSGTPRQTPKLIFWPHRPCSDLPDQASDLEPPYGIEP
jgi:hypothetical protein